jgi:hypothetical protein
MLVSSIGLMSPYPALLAGTSSRPKIFDATATAWGRRVLVPHIKRYGAHLVAIPLDQIGELLRIARRCNEVVSCSEYRFGKRASKATRTACN